MGTVSTAGAHRKFRRVARKLAAFAIAVTAFAGAANASVNIYTTNSSAGTINRYTDGVLTGQIPGVGSTNNDFSRSIELGPNGNLYVDRLSDSFIQQYNPTTLAPVGSPITINSNGGSSHGAYDMSFDTAGNLYIAVMSDDSIQKALSGLLTSSNLVSKQSGGLRVPLDTLVIGNTLYVSAFNLGDGTNGSVMRFNATTGQFIDTMVPAGSHGLRGPVGLALAPDGNLLVSGHDSSNILKFNPSTGAFISTFVATGYGGIEEPIDITLDKDNGNLYVANRGDNSVLEYDGTTGAFIGVAVASGAGGLNGIAYLAVTGSNSASPVPLPAGVWGAIVTLAMFGGYSLTKRRKAVPVTVR